MRAKIGWGFRGLAIVAALLATIQPVLGPMALFRSSGSINYGTLHLVMGGILYNVAILLAVLAPITLFGRRWILCLISVAQYGLLHLQLRTGLGTNDDTSLLEYHIPVGVLIVLIAYVTVALSFGMRFDYRRA